MLIAVASVVAAIAVVIAVYYAYLTVSETRALRLDSRFDRVLDCLADYSLVLVTNANTSSIQGDVAKHNVEVARLRLVAALDAAHVDLPTSRDLAREDRKDRPPSVVTARTAESIAEVERAMTR